VVLAPEGEIRASDIPKDIREQAHIEAGVPLEIRYRDGRIEIEPAPRRVEIVTRGRLRVAVPTDTSARLRAEVVRNTRDRIRDRDR